MGLGTLRFSGQTGGLWSSMAADTDSRPAVAYFLTFTDLGLSPSYGPWERFRGYPVCCLASGA